MVFLSNKNVTVMLSWLIIIKQLAATNSVIQHFKSTKFKNFIDLEPD